jgi:hypothetical protein
MSWRGWLFGNAAPAPHAPHALTAGIEKQGRQYLDDADTGKWIYPACKRAATDAGADRQTVGDHTRLEAFRYLLMVPRGEFKLLAQPDSQTAILEAYLRQRPHEDTVIEFSGNTMNDLASLAGADRRPFSGTLNHFRKVATSAQKWWETEGAKQRCAEMLQAGQEPPLFLYLVWADYGRLAREIAAGRSG